ncbi:MAG: glycosyltransferase [Pseudomonadota bacterium]
MSKVDAEQPLPISAVMICGDEAALIEQCIESLVDLGEVCIYFNGKDATKFQQMVAGFPNVVVHEGPFMGFGPSKQRAVSLAKNDWVLSIDSDEWLGRGLRDALRQIPLESHRTAFQVLRKNRFMGVSQTPAQPLIAVDRQHPVVFG